MDFTFLLKKIASMFIMPLPIGIILIVLALLLLKRNNIKKAKFVLTLSITWFFLFSYSPFVDTLLHTLESNHPTLHKAPKDIKHIYVLGSGHTTDENLPITSQLSQTAVIRLNEGILLYHQLQGEAKIIVSGYHGLYDTTEHAKMQERLAVSLGVKKEDMILHLGTKDTQEEAEAGKKLLGEKPFILVTSASHMTRALNFFTHEGLHPIPAPTNHLASIQYLNYASIFSSHTFDKSRIIFHEILGLLWQKIKGI